MLRPQVIITDYIHDDLQPERELLGDLADLVALHAHGEAELAGQIEEADALMVYHDLALSSASLRRLRHCRLIVRVGVGYDNVDGSAARQQGIPLVNIPDYGTEEVADSAIGMLLMLTRGILHQQVHLQRHGGPWSYRAAAPLRRLRGQVLAIVGLGRIGTATAIRAQSLGMDVVYYDPYLADGYDKALGVRRVETLESLFRQAFVLSLHCPLTPETRDLVNAQTIGWLPAGAYLVNTARGAPWTRGCCPPPWPADNSPGPPWMCSPTSRLDRKTLCCAWHDPAHPASSRLIINPHAAFYCEEGLLEMRRKAARVSSGPHRPAPEERGELSVQSPAGREIPQACMGWS